MNSFDRIIDIFKIIHGTSLSAGNIFKKETASHNTEYIEAFALDQEMKYLSEAYALSGEEKSLIQVCMQLYNLLQNESISVDRRVRILHDLKKACFRFSKIRAENERRIAETGSLDDKSWLLFNGVKTPYYTVNESKRSLYHLIARRPLPQFTSLTVERSELRSLRVEREGMNCPHMYLSFTICERFTSSV